MWGRGINEFVDLHFIDAGEFAQTPIAGVLPHAREIRSPGSYMHLQPPIRKAADITFGEQKRDAILEKEFSMMITPHWHDQDILQTSRITGRSSGRNTLNVLSRGRDITMLLH